MLEIKAVEIKISESYVQHFRKSKPGALTTESSIHTDIERKRRFARSFL